MKRISSLPSRPYFGRGAGGEGIYYFLMEFVDGLTLRQLLDAGKLAPQEALAIVPQICEALQFAHDKGVVHRDIKPENILMDRSGQVKIADFGLAKLVGQEAKDFSLTGTGQVMGTPHYMAPEQTEHPQEVDHRADIYSLGVVFYQMLTGELPIGRFAPPSKKVQIDVRLDEVVLRALEKEPELRYQQASELKTEVETIAQTKPKASPARVPSPIERAFPELGDWSQTVSEKMDELLSACAGWQASHSTGRRFSSSPQESRGPSVRSSFCRTPFHLFWGEIRTTISATCSSRNSLASQ